MPTIERISMMDTPRALRSIAPGTSLGDVARGTGITHSHLSRIFNGHRKPSLGFAETIASYLGVSLDELSAALAEASATTPTRIAA